MSIASAVGIDLGSRNIVLSTIRGGTIECLTNDLSNRLTPTYVSFGNNQRFIGESGFTKVNANFRNTIPYSPRLLGLQANSEQLQFESKWLTSRTTTNEQGQLVHVVNYMNEERQFTTEQLVAMLLVQVREICKAQNVSTNDVVISVPSYFTEAERRAMLDACDIAQMPCLRIINDVTAAALSYGLFRKSQFSENPRIVAFADLGHSKFSLAIVKFLTDKLEVLAHGFDRNLGTRDFDWRIMEHLSDQFQKQYGEKPIEMVRPKLKLALAVERLRKVLSGNTEADINLEYLVEDYDLNATITRDQFEQMNSDLLEKIRLICKQALQESGVEKVDFVELVGGGTRIAAVQQILIEEFQVEQVSKTLNADETISRGCAIQAAMLSPQYKVKDFGVQDICSYPIDIAITPLESDEQVTPDQFFKPKNVFPIIKILRPTTPLPFKIDLGYNDNAPFGVPQNVGRYAILPPDQPIEGEYKVKVNIKMNIHGVVNLESAEGVQSYIENVPVPVQEEKKEEAEGEEPVQEFTQKKRTRRIPLPFQTQNYGLSPDLKQQFIQQEAQMDMNDKITIETMNRKNELESSVYEWRDRLNGSYKEYVNSDTAQQILDLLKVYEEWLYAEGRDTNKQEYIDRLSTIRDMTQAIQQRFIGYQEAPSLFQDIKATIQRCHLRATTQEEQYAHISQEEREQIINICNELMEQAVMAESMCQAANKMEDLPFNKGELVKKQIYLQEQTDRIMNKPKPAPPKQETQEEQKDTQEDKMDLDEQNETEIKDEEAQMELD